MTVRLSSGGAAAGQSPDEERYHKRSNKRFAGAYEAENIIILNRLNIPITQRGKGDDTEIHTAQQILCRLQHICIPVKQPIP